MTDIPVTNKNTWLRSAVGTEPLQKYPGPAEVKQAQESGFGYGTGNESLLSGERAGVWSFPSQSKPGTRIAFGVDEAGANAQKLATEPRAQGMMPGTEQTKQLYNAAQLAVLRSPISAIGFNPAKAALDIKSGPEVTVAGMYDPKLKTVYSNAVFMSNIVHESTHAGLAKLREIGILTPDLEQRLPKEEDIVRYIMTSQMGDPEAARKDVGAIERQQGTAAFTTDKRADDRQKALQELTDKTAQYIAQVQAKGPK